MIYVVSIYYNRFENLTTAIKIYFIGHISHRFAMHCYVALSKLILCLSKLINYYVT